MDKMMIADKTYLSLGRAAFFFMMIICQIGCEKPEVIGQVVDQNGSPLESVHINIANSELSTQSDKDGKYKITYLPGKFSVEFKKDGYASSSIQLEIDTESRFPAKKITLWKVPEAQGVFLLEDGNYIPLKESNVSMRGNLMQTITGIKTPSLLQVRTQTPVFVFYGAKYPTDGLFLFRIGYTGTKKIQGVFGATRQKVNLWTASREKSQIKIEKLDSNLSVLRPTGQLAVGNYAFHWGILFADDPIAVSGMQNKMAYDFTVSAISSTAENKSDKISYAQGQNLMATPFKLTVYGWSKDSNYWAFGEAGDYGGGAVERRQSSDYIIQSIQNDFYKTFKNHRNAAMAKMNDLGISKSEGTVVYKKPIGKYKKYDSELVQFGEKLVEFQHDGVSYKVKLEDVHQGEDNWLADHKSKFTISIARRRGSWKVLQTDKSLGRIFFTYRIVHVYISPDGKKIAVAVEAGERGFENAVLVRYKGITGLLP